MTPEQLARLRQWAAWGESPTPETTIALLDHIEWQHKQFKRVRDGLTNHSRKLWAIRKLHTSVKPDSDGEHYLDPLTRKPKCGECLLIYPCPTIQAIEGGTDGSQ